MLGFTVLVMNDESQESIIARWHIYPQVGTSQRFGQQKNNLVANLEDARISHL